MNQVRRFMFLVAGLGLWSAPTLPDTHGCGPDFPNSFLSNSVDELSSLPTLSFERELIRLLPSAPPKRGTPDEEKKRLAEAEIAEVREALRKVGLAPDKIEESVKSYRREQPAAELPREFAMYAEGANEWHAENYGNAQKVWRDLLALPPEQRRYRTVWAAYMIGRMLWATEPAKAREAMALAREAAEQGFADSQELFMASLGWDARTYFRSGDYATALKLYFKQFAHGDSTALASLQFTLQRVFQGTPDIIENGGQGSTGLIREIKPYPASDYQLRRIAAEKELRGVVAAWFAARGGPRLHWSNADSAQHLTGWLRILREMADQELAANEADRYCWVAYQAGLWEDAQHFAELAPKDTPTSEWVRAMLLLRSGKTDDAAEHMANASRYFSKDSVIGGIEYDSSRWECYGEMEQQPLRTAPMKHLGGVRGVLALSREKYTDALRLFLGSGHASDAAYVAEYVLTVDELLKFVREERPARPGIIQDKGRWKPLDLQYLLARRLVRSGRFDEAAEFFPEKLRPSFDLYVTEVRRAYDLDQSARTRAESFWKAAKLVQMLGMEIQGTELEPDYSIWDGSYQWPLTWSYRAYDGQGSVMAKYGHEESLWKRHGIFGPSSNELDRAQKAKIPSRRYHYRYRATELAWLAAGLLPNDDELTATILNVAGQWVAARDPQSADLFYKTLVIRCPRTALGKAATDRRWLVPVNSATAETAR
ncbi:MAG: hypothetical protein QM715_00400 [Nibricoccus sp.]